MSMESSELKAEVDENTFLKEALQCEIGEKLKKTRQEKDISPDFILKELKFSKTFLEALESGNWQNLPGEVYALGFLKQYSSLLELDISDDIQRIKSQTFELNKPLTYPDEVISPNRRWVFIAVALFVFIIIVVNLSSDEDVLEKPLEPTQETSTDSIIAPAPLIPTLDNDIYTLPETLPTESPLNVVEELPAEEHTYTFLAAVSDVWLQVFEESGTKLKLLHEVLLKQGESFSIKNTSAKLLLTAGNSRALEVLKDDQVLFAKDTLGREGKVLKLYPINP